MAFDKWRARLAGEKVLTFTQPDHEDEGYYRIPITEKAANGSGRNIIKGWIPVAYFLYDGTLSGNIGDGDGSFRAMTDDEVIDRWTWCCAHPVFYEWYQAVAERGEPWPDMAAADPAGAASNDAPIPTAIEGKRVGNNQPEPPPAEVVPPEVAHAKAIDDAIAAAIRKIETDADAESALGSKNRIAELRLKADKAGKAVYDPPFREYKRFHGLWSPMVTRAEKAEKALNTNILNYRERVRRENAKAEADRQAVLRDQEEAQQRAADRAIATGAPEPEPELEAAPEPPPAVTPLAPAYGTRTIKEEMKTFLDKVTSWDMLFQHYKGNADVQAVLTKLAAADIKAGRTVPGTITREGLI